MNAINDPQLLISHKDFGNTTQFSFELDNRSFCQSYLLTILSHAAKQIAEKWATENYEAIAKEIDREKIVDSVVVQVARAIAKKWGDEK